MYNIHSHYENIYSYARLHLENPTVKYLFPFGATLVQNVEILRTNDKPGPVLFCYDQEPLIHHYNKFLFTDVNLKASFDILPLIQVNWEKYDLKLTPIILLNTEKDSIEKEKILKEFPFIDCYYFYHALAASDWYRGYEYDFKITPIKQRRFEKKYISFNRITGNSRVYRSLLIAELIRRNILHDGMISYSKNCPVHGSLKKNLLYAKEYGVSNEFLKESYNLIEHHLATDLRIDGSINEQITNDSFTVGPISMSISSFLHVVTETCFWDQKKHLTEKIFKPIVLKQPFVLLGSEGNLSYLKEYGFKTFDKWWDESYDQCKDPIQRLSKVCDIVENICKLSHHDLSDLMLEMEDTLEHNFNRFYSKQFINDVWTELTINLDSAFSQLVL
jgi:hypothetical protein